MPFRVKKLSIPDILLVKPEKFGDDRGFFMELYRESDFREIGIETDFTQDNLSHSRRNVLRGLHYQREPHQQAKLIICLGGEIFDVAVDLRKDSSHFGDWVGLTMKGNTGEILYIPEGFAHGFLVTGKSADVYYKTGKEYAPESEGGIIWNDPEIDINWPLDGKPILSEKDSNLPELKDAII